VIVVAQRDEIDKERSAFWLLAGWLYPACY
jgi:hypothetical protein